MDREQRIAYIHAQTACMLAELESMKIANVERGRMGAAPAYGEREFLDLPVRMGLSHNQVIDFLRD